MSMENGSALKARAPEDALLVRQAQNGVGLVAGRLIGEMGLADVVLALEDLAGTQQALLRLLQVRAQESGTSWRADECLALRTERDSLARRHEAIQVEHEELKQELAAWRSGRLAYAEAEATDQLDLPVGEAVTPERAPEVPAKSGNRKPRKCTAPVIYREALLYKRGKKKGKVRAYEYTHQGAVIKAASDHKHRSGWRYGTAEGGYYFSFAKWKQPDHVAKHGEPVKCVVRIMPEGGAV